MNKYILDSKIVLFLGAGASEYLGKPLMQNFIDILVADLEEKFKEIVNAIVETKGKDLEKLLNEIDGICERTYFRGNKQNYFIAQFDPVSAFTRFLTAGTSGSKTELPYKSHFAEKYENLCRDCIRLRWLIYDKIFEVYFDIDQIKVNKLYGPFFSLLKNVLDKKATLPIFTTNYDNAIEVFSDKNGDIELMDGFEFNRKTKTNTWHIKMINNFKPKKGKINVCLFKLHGSIFWYRIGEEIVYSPIPTQFPSGINIEPVILYPNNTKDIAFSDPFITSYSYLQRCFDRAQYIIFIGYSFRDYITIAFLKNALRLNNKLKVLLIDPNATKLFESYFKFYKSNFICIDKKFTDKVEDYQEEIKKVITSS